MLSKTTSHRIHSSTKTFAVYSTFVRPRRSIDWKIYRHFYQLKSIHTKETRTWSCHRKEEESREWLTTKMYKRQAKTIGEYYIKCYVQNVADAKKKLIRECKYWPPIRESKQPSDKQRQLESALSTTYEALRMRRRNW